MQVEVLVQTAQQQDELVAVRAVGKKLSEQTDYARGTVYCAKDISRQNETSDDAEEKRSRSCEERRQGDGASTTTLPVHGDVANPGTHSEGRRPEGHGGAAERHGGAEGRPLLTVKGRPAQFIWERVFQE